MSGPVDVRGVIAAAIAELRVDGNTGHVQSLLDADAAVAASLDDIAGLERHLRAEANARQERIANFDGDTSPEGMLAQEMLATFAEQLSGYADDCSAALARIGGAK